MVPLKSTRPILAHLSIQYFIGGFSHSKIAAVASYLCNEKKRALGKGSIYIYYIETPFQKLSLNSQMTLLTTGLTVLANNWKWREGKSLSRAFRMVACCYCSNACCILSWVFYIIEQGLSCFPGIAECSQCSVKQN